MGRVKHAQTPSEQVARAPEAERGMLQHLYARARELAPDAEEGTSYGMPALRYRGRPLVSVMPTRAGFSVYPFSAEAVAEVLPLVEGFSSSKGGIRFTAERAIPDCAFDALVTTRIEQIDAAIGH